MGDKIVILGTDDKRYYGSVIYAHFTEDSPHQVVAFTSNKDFLGDRTMTRFGIPYVPYESIVEYYPPGEYKIFIAVAYSKMNDVRARLFHECKGLGYELASYISSDVRIWNSVKVGEHVVILSHNSINPEVTIGNNVIVWDNNHIGHNSILEDNVYIASNVGISGNNLIRRNCFFGTGANTADQIEIGEYSLIDAGITIKQNVPPETFIKNDQKEARPYNTRRYRGIED